VEFGTAIAELADDALMQRAVPVWEAAGFLGMSAEVLLSTYDYHHPDFLHGAANANTSKHRVRRPWAMLPRRRSNKFIEKL
jgi:hypothetical protein